MGTKRHFDSIVVGTGGVGSAALFHLAHRGEKVLGIDRFRPPHAYGSSHGQTRIIRQAYFEHPDYTPLLLEAYRLWGELETQSQRQLYSQVGVLQIGPPEGEVACGVKLSAETHGLEVEELSAEAVQSRWPSLSVPTDMIGLFEPKAGYLRVEQCVAAHLDTAIASGAELKTDLEVLSWQAGPPAVVATSDGEFVADRLVIAAGAWASSLLGELGLQMQVLRKSLFWQPVSAGQESLCERLPCFLYELPEGVFYGLPPLDERGVKLAEHSGGQIVDDPLHVNRDIDADDRQRIEDFSTTYLQGISSRISDHSVCLYTMSPDQHFIVDLHSEHPHVAFAAGLSGHGFKFAPVLGKALADLVLDGASDLPVGFLARR